MNTGRSLIALLCLPLAVQCHRLQLDTQCAIGGLDYDALSDFFFHTGTCEGLHMRIVQDFNRNPSQIWTKSPRKADDQVEAEAAMADFRALLRGCVNSTGVIPGLIVGPVIRSQPMLVVHDVAAASSRAPQALGLTSGHGGDEYESADERISDVVVQLHHWDADEHPHLGDPDDGLRGNGASRVLRSSDPTSSTSDRRVGRGERLHRPRSVCESAFEAS